jgi:hypothetical protein
MSLFNFNVSRERTVRDTRPQTKPAAIG